MSDREIRSAGSAVKDLYADVNGIHLYYQVHGQPGAGPPLILLHGGLGQVAMFSEVLPLLARTRQVIGVDLQGHGRTADIDRPLRFEFMADDVAALIGHLGLEQADLAGYSLGGGVALQTAVRHPDVVRKLVLISTPFRRSGWFPEVLEGMDQMVPEAAEVMKPSPIYQAYAAVAPRPEDFPRLVGKLGELLREDYDWSLTITEFDSPTLLVFGDADAIRPAHVLEFFERLGGGLRDAGLDGSGIPPRARLAVLPGTTHYNSFQSLLLAAVIPPFLAETDRAGG
ncbi:MAG TPA: alpha/beta hydrolase [Anaerolineaceae bacterium]|nr:alpha/beta hydrolase [Anaerolineaceae bacterium]